MLSKYTCVERSPLTSEVPKIGKGVFAYSRVPEDLDWYGNCPDGQREHMTGNV